MIHFIIHRFWSDMPRQTVVSFHFPAILDSQTKSRKSFPRFQLNIRLGYGLPHRKYRHKISVKRLTHHSCCFNFCLCYLIICHFCLRILIAIKAIKYTNASIHVVYVKKYKKNSLSLREAISFRN